MSRVALRPVVLLVGVLHLGAGFFMAVAPRGFYDTLGTYPPFNGHYVRDLSTFYLALGAMLMLSSARRAWQVPLLMLTVIQYALHVVNHILDIGDTEPGWKGPANAAWLAFVLGVLWLLLRAASRQAQQAGSE